MYVVLMSYRNWHTFSVVMKPFKPRSALLSFLRLILKLAFRAYQRLEAMRPFRMAFTAVSMPVAVLSPTFKVD